MSSNPPEIPTHSGDTSAESSSSKEKPTHGDETTETSDPQEEPTNDDETIESGDSQEIPAEGDETIGSDDSQEIPTVGDETTGSSDSQEIPAEGDETIGSGDSQEIPTVGDETTGSGDSQEIPAEGDETIGSDDSQEIPTVGDETTGSDDSQEIPAEGDETIGSGDSQEIPTDGDEAMGSGDPQPPELPPATTSQATTSSATTTRRVKLFLNPDRDHIPDTYDDPELEFSSEVLSQLEMHLPTELLTANKDEKAKVMSDILGKYICRKDCVTRKTINRYKEKIKSSFRPYYQWLYEFQATHYTDPSFLEAISKKELKSFKGIIQPSFGIFIFPLLNPNICDLLVQEVEHFRRWARESNFEIREATKVHKDSVVLDDFGLDRMLNELINHYVRPFVQEFFPEMCGVGFDSHHGFIVDRTTLKNNTALLTLSDDSDITLDVCLSDKQSMGGQFYFRGTRCEKHETTASKPKEIFEYRPKPGQAVLHHRRTRYGTKAITSGQRTNMIVWCRSFVWKEMRTTYFKDIDSTVWCGKCGEDERAKEKQRVIARKNEVVIAVEPAEQAQVNTTPLTIGDQPTNP